MINYLSICVLSLDQDCCCTIIYVNFTQFLTKKNNFADLFSLHIFVRLKELHGWKEKGNKNISVKQIQHGRIGKIKSISQGSNLHQEVCMQYLRCCMWL